MCSDLLYVYLLSETATTRIKINWYIYIIKEEEAMDREVQQNSEKQIDHFSRGLDERTIGYRHQF